MSKFVEKLQSVYRGVTPAMGFLKTVAAAQSFPLLLIADLTKSTPQSIKGVVSGGIDAAVMSSEGVDVQKFKRLVANLGDVPLGLLFEGSSHIDASEFVDLGCDFIVFNLETPLDMVNREGLGKILKIDQSLVPGLARIINDFSLPVDAVLVSGDDSPITVERLLFCQFFSELLNKPLLVNSSLSLTGGELSSLCKAGVNGLLLQGKMQGKAFTELKKAAGNLPETAGKRTGLSVLIPKLSGAVVSEVGEEEEEDDI